MVCLGFKEWYIYYSVYESEEYNTYACINSISVIHAAVLELRCQKSISFYHIPTVGRIKYSQSFSAYLVNIVCQPATPTCYSTSPSQSTTTKLQRRVPGRNRWGLHCVEIMALGYARSRLLCAAMLIGSTPQRGPLACADTSWHFIHHIPPFLIISDRHSPGYQQFNLKGWTTKHFLCL